MRLIDYIGQLPPITPEVDPNEATIEDFENALETLGVDMDSVNTDEE